MISFNVNIKTMSCVLTEMKIMFYVLMIRGKKNVLFVRYECENNVLCVLMIELK